MKEFYNIVATNGHYEIYDSFGEFVSSGDTYSECESEIAEMTAA